MKSYYDLQNHYGDERDKTVFHNTTPDLQDQDQDHSVQDQDQRPIFWSQTGLFLRPTVSDHMAYMLSGTGILECLEIIEVVNNLKQFDGLT